MPDGLPGDFRHERQPQISLTPQGIDQFRLVVLTKRPAVDGADGLQVARMFGSCDDFHS